MLLACLQLLLPRCYKNTSVKIFGNTKIIQIVLQPTDEFDELLCTGKIFLTLPNVNIVDNASILRLDSYYFAMFRFGEVDLERLYGVWYGNYSIFFESDFIDQYPIDTVEVITTDLPECISNVELVLDEDGFYLGYDYLTCILSFKSTYGASLTFQIDNDNITFIMQKWHLTNNNSGVTLYFPHNFDTIESMKYLLKSTKPAVAMLWDERSPTLKSEVLIYNIHYSGSRMRLNSFTFIDDEMVISYRNAQLDLKYENFYELRFYSFKQEDLINESLLEYIYNDKLFNILSFNHYEEVHFEREKMLYYDDRYLVFDNGVCTINKSLYTLAMFEYISMQNDTIVEWETGVVQLNGQFRLKPRVVITTKKICITLLSDELRNYTMTITHLDEVIGVEFEGYKSECIRGKYQHVISIIRHGATVNLRLVLNSEIVIYHVTDLNTRYISIEIIVILAIMLGFTLISSIISCVLISEEHFRIEFIVERTKEEKQD